MGDECGLNRLTPIVLTYDHNVAPKLVPHYGNLC